MHIVDRRLNPGSKSLENRKRFLRRAKALVQGAVKKSTEGRDIKDVLEGGEVGIPLDGTSEPRFRREGGTRDMVLPGNKTFVEGDVLPRSGGEGRGRPTEPGEGDSEDAFRFVLSRDEFVDLFLDDLELPGLAKRKLARCKAGQSDSFGAAGGGFCRRTMKRQHIQPGAHRKVGETRFLSTASLAGSVVRNHQRRCRRHYRDDGAALGKLQHIFLEAIAGPAPPADAERTFGRREQSPRLAADDAVLGQARRAGY